MQRRSLSDLPDLAEDYPLSAEQIGRYQRDGHILLWGVASPAEVAAYRPCILEAVRRYNTEARPLDERDTYGKAFLQIMWLWEKDEAARRFVLARRFARIAADLMGVEGVRVFQDQALFKEPGGGLTPWHTDQEFWPMRPDDATISMWMPLLDVPVEMGTMMFVSGSQRQYQNRRQLGISDESEAYFQQLIAEHGLSIDHAGAMAAGDATFHNGWTLHRAAPNTTGTMREVMTINYCADGARVVGPDVGVRQDEEVWPTGLKAGDLVAGPRNPLAYSRRQ